MKNIFYICAEGCTGLDCCGVTWWAYIIPILLSALILYVLFRFFPIISQKLNNKGGKNV